MRLCYHMRWTLGQFNALSLDERNKWLVWQARIERESADRTQDALKPDSDGKVHAEVVTARLLLARQFTG